MELRAGRRDVARWKVQWVAEVAQSRLDATRRALEQLDGRPHLRDVARLAAGAMRLLAREAVARGASRLRSRGALFAALSERLPERLRAALGQALMILEQDMAETGSKPPSSGETHVSELGTDVRPGSVSSHTQVEAQQKYPEPAPPPPPPAYEDPPAAKEAKHFDALLGQLPYSYGEDDVVLLPRDPFSCWVFWDFAHHTLERAFEHLPYPVARLRIYVDEEPFREIDCVLEARGWWLYGLIPGRRYAVELLAVGSNGETRRIGPQSNRCVLPPSGPSAIVNDRFIRIPFDVPPRGVLEGRRGDPFRQLVAEATEGGAPEVAGGFTPELREELYRLSGGEFIRYIGASETVVEKLDQWGRRLVPMPGAGENIVGDRLGSPSGGGRWSGRWPGSSWSSAVSGPTGKPSPSPDTPVLDRGEEGGSNDR